MLRANEVLIHDGNFHEFVSPLVDGEPRSRGLIPRNYETHPVGHYRAAVPYHAIDFPLIDQSEWSSRLKDMIANSMLLSDLRLRYLDGQPVPSLDQDGVGYCWAHSSTSAHMLIRMLMHLPYVPLSAFAVAATIKNGRDEGGWGAESLDFIMERGQPSQELWPQGSRDLSHGNAACWENAKHQRVTEGFVDLQAAQYDRKLTFAQVATLLLTRVPVVSDFNWWSHSVCAIDLVDGSTQWATCRAASGKIATVQEFDLFWGMNDPVTAGFGVRIWNSWSNSWSDRGMGVLTGGKAIPDGSVAPRMSAAA